jgi:glucans biosynthesis protein C
MEKSKPLNREYDMDWIRVIATLAVFLYHCSMFVNPFPWHVKNNEIDSSYILVFSLFVGSWIMPIFFAISGMNVSHAFKRRTNTLYIKERFMRLGIPLIFGVFILTPPQIYIERLTNNQFQGSFFAFFPHYFDGVYLDFNGDGNFAFSGLHLWYLLVLLLFSLFTLPVFRKVRMGGEFGRIHLIVLPILLIGSSMIQTLGVGGWDLVYYLLIFTYGFYFFTSPEFKPTIQASINYLVVVAILTSIIYITWFMKGYPHQDSIADTLFFALKTINCWSLLLCISYLADKYLSFSNRFLQYGSEASMPFYVLHQPVIIFLGFLLRDLAWPLPMKLLVLIPVSFLLIMLCYHFVIRKVNVLRILFGMKGMKKVKEVNRGITL